jgi:TctA family transporter
VLEALAIALGTLTGVLASLGPGLHAALALTFLVAFGLSDWLGPGAATVFIASAAGAIVYTRRLGAVYHPSAVGAASEHQAMDVAQRLTADGQGPTALRLMVLAVDLSWLPVLGLATTLLAVHAAGIDLATPLAHALGHLALPVIAVWTVFTVLRSRSRALTLVGLILTGACGYAVLHHPALVGNEHQLAPLMGGLFGIPMMLAVIREGRSELAIQRPFNGILDCVPALGVLGGVIGVFSGFISGIGAGSLIGMLHGLTDSDTEYLVMATAGEAAKETAALLLILLAGAGHTGEAQLLGRVAAPHMTSPQVLLVLTAVVIGAVVGRKVVFGFEVGYQALIRKVSPATWAYGVIALACWQLWLAHTGLLAFELAAACVFTALWSRHQQLPLQVGFAGLAIPLVLSETGLVPVINHVFTAF